MGIPDIKDVSVDEAFERIVKEFDALGYQELRMVYNERVAELGLN